MNARILAAGTLAVLALYACGKSSQPAPVATAAQANGKSADQVPRKKLPQADPATPDSQYIEIESGNQIMFLYYALAGMPADYDAIARSYSADYRNTSDAFRKQDILTSLKPRIDTGIERAKSEPYLRYRIKPELAHYDFAAKAFPVRGLRSSASWYVSDNPHYQLIFSNSEAFASLPVGDESLARELERAVSDGREPEMLVYGFAQEVDLNQKLVRAQIVKVEVLGKNQTVAIRYPGQ